METAGLVGGIGPESTIEYYRLIIASYRDRVRDGSYPHLILNSVDLTKMLDLVGAGKLSETTEFLLGALDGLAKAGAHFGALAANTPHVVLDALRRRSPIPLVSIVEETCRAARGLGLERVGLFGVRFTMQGRFYPDVFSPEGVSLVVPAPEEQDYIHAMYMNELIPGIIRQETRDGLLSIVQRLKIEQRIQGLILGGTELSLILRDSSDAGIPFLDTTRIHAEAIVARMLSGGS